MVDLKLKHVVIRNWMKFQQVDLDFPESGLVLVQGVNTASGGALLSVGSGKTGIGEAISRTLLGITGRFTHLKQFSRDKGGDTYVKLEASLHNKLLIVESGYKCKELSTVGEALRYSYDGKTIERGKIEQTRSELNKLLGISSLLASWTIFIDGDDIKFNKLTQADCVELVMSSLKQPPWSDYHESSKQVLGKFKRSMAGTEADHSRALSSLSDAKADVAEETQQLQLEQSNYDKAVADNEKMIEKFKLNIDSTNKIIEETNTSIKEIAQKLKLMEEEKAIATHKIEIKLHAIEDELTKAENARKPYSEAMIKTQQKATEARVAHRNYANSAKNCPTCGQATGKIDEDRLTKFTNELEEASKANNKAQDNWAKTEQTVVTLSLKHREISKQFREISAKAEISVLVDRYEEMERSIDTLKEEIHRYELQLARYKNGPSDANLLIAKDRLKTKKSLHIKAKEKLDEAGKALASDQSALKVLEYWNLAFSPYGIPNMVLRKAIAPLNKEAKRVSATMTGGTIDVRYSTIKEMASGLEKAQLNIEIDNQLGDKNLEGNSKGEAGLTNFIISETLSEVGQVSRRIGYMWLDEVLPNQDPKVCQSFYSYLKEKANRLGLLIFLVDHNPVAANYADKILLVEKVGSLKKCYSKVSWR